MASTDTKDSNATGLAIAEESTPKVLPGTPDWYAKEPNSYADFGGEISTVTREPINQLRQNKRGTTTDLDASGGFNADYTQNNLTRELQGFMYRDIQEKFGTKQMNVAQLPITSTDGTGGYVAASGLDGFKADDLVFASGFTNSANNGLSKVTSAIAALLDTDKATVVEASPPAGAKVETVGYEFPTSDLELTVSGGLATFTSASVTMTTLGLVIGEYIFVGGDVTDTSFPGGVGYFRVKSVTATTIVCDKATDLKVTSSGTGKDIRIFFGNFLQNATAATDIVCRTYQLERTLGDDGSGTQSEYLTGAYANEFNLNVSTADKLTADLSYVAMDNEQRTGTTGVKSGNRIPALGENAINTSSDVYRKSMEIIDDSTLVPDTLFAYLSEFNLNISNGVTPNKAIGTLGAIGISLGNFVVSGSVTAYFTTIAATQAVRNNTDVTIDCIFAKENAGLVFDIPLLGLGGGKVTVEKDAPITVPLENLAAENADGYTLGVTVLPYLPTVAMPA